MNHRPYNPVNPPSTRSSLGAAAAGVATDRQQQRRVYAEVPPRVEYQITPLGSSLRPTLESLAGWMRTHGQTLAAGE
ncbi:winged helix-turn-helix transcriptional regulator [Rubrivivax gelatinosus]|uniref:winged helix-turn-helix transcriptional regulator n=1 Tax=Rubrivivax gelatinosus TaxID=28068 RepID=UPI001E407605|nr:winged helix-turn-helix transcriptional regulator [Rubrivivax gelatinosus]